MRVITENCRILLLMIGHVHSKQSCLFSNVVDFRKKMTSWAFFTVGYRLGKFAANGFGVFFPFTFPEFFPFNFFTDWGWGQIWRYSFSVSGWNRWWRVGSDISADCSHARHPPFCGTCNMQFAKSQKLLELNTEKKNCFANTMSQRKKIKQQQ